MQPKSTFLAIAASCLLSSSAAQAGGIDMNNPHRALGREDDDVVENIAALLVHLERKRAGDRITARGDGDEILEVRRLCDRRVELDLDERVECDTGALMLWAGRGHRHRRDAELERAEIAAGQPLVVLVGHDFGAELQDRAFFRIALDDLHPFTGRHQAPVFALGLREVLEQLEQAQEIPLRPRDVARVGWIGNRTERRRQVATSVADLLRRTRIAGAEVIEVSSATGEGIDALRDKLLSAARTLPHRSMNGRFRLPVDRCFTLPGIGTVVTGTIVSGAIAAGDAVLVSPSGLSARVRSIHAQNRPANRAEAGVRYREGLRDLGFEDLPRALPEEGIPGVIDIPELMRG